MNLMLFLSKSEESVGLFLSRLNTRKNLLFLVVMMFCIKGYAQRVYNFSFSINDYSVSTDGGITSVSSSLPGLIYSNDTSKPNIPAVPIRILLHEDSTSAVYNVEYEKTLIASNITMEACRGALTTNGEIYQGLPYALSSIDNPIENEGMVKYEQIKFLFLKIMPFLYDVSSKNLYFVTNLTITLPYYPQEYYSEWGNGSNMGYPISIMGKILNPADFEFFYPTTSQTLYYPDPIDYLIITSSSLADSFETLKEWKIRKGLHTRIITTDSIYSAYSGADNQEKIKSCIFDQFSNHGVKWVLIGGDDYIVPARYCRYKKYTNDYSYIFTTPADLYYACLVGGSFSWDGNGNGIYGEEDDNIDLNADVYLSRLPVRYSADVAAYTSKLLKYERDIPNDNAAKRVLLTGYSQSNGHICSAETYNENLKQEYITPYLNGEVYYMYENNNSLPESSSYNISSSNLQTELNRGYNLVHEVSHGSYNSWYLGSTSYLGSQAALLTNSMPSVILTIACSSNQFDEEPCLSEQFIRNPNGGAVAYFGSSREGYGGYNGRIDQSFLYNGRFFENLLRGMPDGNAYSFAAVADKAKKDMIELSLHDTSVERWLQYSINPMGDPEMQIHTAKPSTFYTLQGHFEIPPMVMAMYDYIYVSSPVDSCKFVLVDTSGKIYVKKDVSSATFSNLPQGVYKLTILKHNYKPYLTTVSLINTPLYHMQLNVIGDNTLNVRIAPSRLIEIDERNENRQGDNWNLFISNTITGERKVNGIIIGDNCSVDTSGWPAGIYAVNAFRNNEVLSSKIHIK